MGFCKANHLPVGDNLLVTLTRASGYFNRRTIEKVSGSEGVLSEIL